MSASITGSLTLQQNVARIALELTFHAWLSTEEYFQWNPHPFPCTNDVSLVAAPEPFIDPEKRPCLFQSTVLTPLLCEVPLESRTLVVWQVRGQYVSMSPFSTGGSPSPISTRGIMVSILQGAHLLQTLFSNLSDGMTSHPQCLCTASCCRCSGGTSHPQCLHCFLLQVFITTPALSLMRVFMMMLGEIDYIATFLEPYIDDDPVSMHFSGLTFAFLILFTLLMPILLMNLLVGLYTPSRAEFLFNWRASIYFSDKLLVCQTPPEVSVCLWECHLKLSHNCWCLGISGKTWELTSQVHTRDFGQGARRKNHKSDAGAILLSCMFATKYSFVDCKNNFIILEKRKSLDRSAHGRFLAVFLSSVFTVLVVVVFRLVWLLVTLRLYSAMPVWNAWPCRYFYFWK